MKKSKRNPLTLLKTAAVFCLAMMVAGCGPNPSIDASKTPGGTNSPDETKPDANTNAAAHKTLDALLERPAEFPFAVFYNGTKFNGFGEGFSKEAETTTEEADGTRMLVDFLHTESGATFRLNLKAYQNFDAFEWTVFITNGSSKKTAAFSAPQANMVFAGADPVLKGIQGDLGDMYAPYSVSLKKSDVHKESTSGRPTHGNFPYFNLEYGDGGTFIAVGWPGCWKADFLYAKEDTVSFSAGQRNVRTCLEPGETIRTPLMAFLNYQGRDEQVNMNLWRRWFIECNMHKDTAGEVMQPAVAWGNIVQGKNTGALKRTINTYLAHGIKLDYFWMDAGWYVNANNAPCSWPETGMWKINERDYPDKFSEVSALMHENGGKTMLWFEPEMMRLNKRAFLRKNPDFKEEWLLGDAMEGTWLAGQLMDLSNPELRAWLESRIFQVLDEGNIDMYRQDFNADPAPVWKKRDQAAGSDRTGFTENQYVQGYLRFWDDILERYPDMCIDSCASGGGRNDLETLRRAVPLHCSDFWDGNTTGGINEAQAVLMSLSEWIPYFKLHIYEIVDVTEYRLRSTMAAMSCWDVSALSKSVPWDLLQKAYQEHKQLSDFYFKDFYQLTPVSKANDVWRALEYVEPDGSAAAVLCFRAEKCSQDTVTLVLRGLDAQAEYTVKDCNGLIDTVLMGSNLMENGLTVTLENAGASALIFINRK